MHVRFLDYTVFDPTGWNGKSSTVSNPSWTDIELAIRRLDRFEYPYVLLWATEDESKHNHNEGELLEILGGKGAYWLAGTFEGYFQRRLDDSEKGEAQVEVWTSDQGFADAERHLCREIEAVIHAARYYCDHGGFDPSLKWEDSE